MKVKDAIKALKKLNQNEEIIIAWWEKDGFNASQKDWDEIIPNADSDLEWSETYEDLTHYIESFKD